MEQNNNTIRITFKARNNILLSKREELGLSQIEMAAYCDVPLYAYGPAERLEYDNDSASEKNLRKIADTLETDFDVLSPNWASLAGKIINSPNNYLLLDDEYAQQKLLTSTNEFGNSPKLLKESFDKDLRQLIDDRLNKQEAEVIKSYFGMMGYEQLNLEQIGEKLNITRERVRQIKEKALRSLRHDSKLGISSGLLKSYMGSDFQDIDEKEGGINDY